jgi:hypothetical protein
MRILFRPLGIVMSRSFLGLMTVSPFGWVIIKNLSFRFTGLRDIMGSRYPLPSWNVASLKRRIRGHSKNYATLLRMAGSPFIAKISWELLAVLKRHAYAWCYIFHVNCMSAFFSFSNIMLTFAAKIRAIYAQRSSKRDVKGKGKVGTSNPVHVCSTELNAPPLHVSYPVDATGGIPSTGNPPTPNVGTEATNSQAKHRRLVKQSKILYS